MNRSRKALIMGLIVLLCVVLGIALKPSKKKAITPDEFVDTMKSLGYYDYSRDTYKDFDQYFFETDWDDRYDYYLDCGLLVCKNKAYQEKLIDELKADFKNEKKTNPDFVKWTEKGSMLRYEKRTPLGPYTKRAGKTEFYIVVDNTILGIVVQDEADLRYAYDILRAFGYYSYEKGFE